MRRAPVIKGLAISIALASLVLAISPLLGSLEPRNNLGVATDASLLELKPVLSALIFAAAAALLSCAAAIFFSPKALFPVLGMALASGTVLALGTAEQFFPSGVAERTYSLLSMRGDATLVGLAAAGFAFAATVAALVLQQPHLFRPVLREPSPNEG